MESVLGGERPARQVASPDAYQRGQMTPPPLLTQLAQRKRKMNDGLIFHFTSATSESNSRTLPLRLSPRPFGLRNKDGGARPSEKFGAGDASMCETFES
jgi:hypothetical protein